MANKKGNKIRLTLELDPVVDIYAAKENIVAEVLKKYPDPLSLRADVAEIVVAQWPPEKE